MMWRALVIVPICIFAGCGREPERVDYEMRDVPALRVLSFGPEGESAPKTRADEPLIPNQVIRLQGSFPWPQNVRPPSFIRATFYDISRARPTAAGAWVRTAPPPVDARVTYDLRVRAPRRPGRYDLRLSVSGNEFARRKVQVGETP